MIVSLIIYNTKNYKIAEFIVLYEPNDYRYKIEDINLIKMDIAALTM